VQSSPSLPSSTASRNSSAWSCCVAWDLLQARKHPIALLVDEARRRPGRAVVPVVDALFSAPRRVHYQQTRGRFIGPVPSPSSLLPSRCGLCDADRARDGGLVIGASSARRCGKEQMLVMRKRILGPRWRGRQVTAENNPINKSKNSPR
jgi:hypothetical protein